jgi:hypothetical protein
MSPAEAARRAAQSDHDTSPEAREAQHALLRGYLDELQTARGLNVTVRTLRAWRQWCRGPPFVKIGKFVYYKISAVEAWLVSLEQKPQRSRRAA